MVLIVRSAQVWIEFHCVMHIPFLISARLCVALRISVQCCHIEKVINSLLVFSLENYDMIVDGAFICKYSHFRSII